MTTGRIVEVVKGRVKNMELKLYNLAMLAAASCLVMILHEIPKTVLFFRMEHKRGLLKELLHLFHYVDPIGLIFSIAGNAPFSKSYVFRAKNKRTNVCLGLTGYGTLFLIFILSSVLRGLAGQNLYMTLFFQNMAIASVGMFVVNLFPAAAFNMGLIIAGTSQEKYLSILKSDYIIKMILILAVLLGLVRSISINAVIFMSNLL